MDKPRKAKDILDAMAKRSFDENQDVFELAAVSGMMHIQFVDGDLIVRHVTDAEMRKCPTDSPSS